MLHICKHIVSHLVSVSSAYKSLFHLLIAFCGQAEWCVVSWMQYKKFVAPFWLILQYTVVVGIV